MKCYNKVRKIIAFLLTLTMTIGLAPVGLAAQADEERDLAQSITEEQLDLKNEYVISSGDAQTQVTETPDKVAPEQQLKSLMFRDAPMTVASNKTYTMEPAFDPEIKNYTVVVPDSIGGTSFCPYALASSASGDIVGEYPNMTKSVTIPNDGAKKGIACNDIFPQNSLEGNTLTIKVGGKEAYVIKIVRQATLNGLTVTANGENVSLTQAFNGSVNNYEAEIPGDAVLSVTPTATVEGVKLSVNGNDAISGTAAEVTPVWGEDETFTLKVTVSGGTARSGEYSVIFTKTRESEVEPKRQLKSLMFRNSTSIKTGKEYPLEPAFDPEIKNYTVVVPDSLAFNGFRAFATLEAGTITVEYANMTSPVSIRSGSTMGTMFPNVFARDSLDGNTLTIKVDGEEAYIVNIVRQATLSGMKVMANGEDVTLTPTFSGTVNEYEAAISDTDLSVTPTATVKETKLTVNGTDAVSGMASEVTPEWGADNTYTMTITAGADNARSSTYKIKFTNTDIKPVKLEVETPPEKTEYDAGEKFDPAGLTLKVTYENETTKIIDSTEFTYEPAGELTPEDTVITLSYKELTLDLEITVNSVLTGAGTSESPYIISSEDDLAIIRQKVAEGVTFTGAYFEIANDISLSSAWEPIGMVTEVNNNPDKSAYMRPFSGNINGRGHTITYASGSRPLLGYVRQASVSNLNLQGEWINGAGLLENYVVDYNHGSGDTSATATLTISNVTILSGTRIKRSGFLGGYASGSNTVNVTGCTVQPDVKIGVNADGSPSGESSIGSFCGAYNGTIQNCVSYADVYGVNYVGGLAGVRGQSKGSRFAILGSQFHGTVTATGKGAGGIAGSGYYSSTAPNTDGAIIENCTVDGTVTGNNHVGGIIGAITANQTWDNGPESIRNNDFTGTVRGNNAVGGIIGYARNINKNTTIENNYFAPGCGAASGIGATHHVDTSARPLGYDDDGVFYFDSSKFDTYTPEQMEQVYAGVCEGWESGDPTGGVEVKNQNRTDDPLGADIGKLFRNSSGPYTKSIEISGSYKTAYLVGEALDMTGAVFTVTWSDGRTEEVSIDQVKITGFDTNTPGEQTLTAAYGTTSVTFTVTVTPKSSKITVTVSILGDSKHGDNGQVHTFSGGGLSIWAAAEPYEADTAETLWTLLQRVFAKHNISWTNPTGNYITSLNGLGEFDNGPLSGWMYRINGVHSNLGVNQQYLHDKDVIIVHYTDDLNKENSSIGGATEDADVKKVIDQIDAIGDNVTLDSKAKVEAARKAYDALTYAQKQQVTNYAKLTAAEAKLKELQAEADKLAAKEVSDQIEALPSPATEDDREAVAAARKAYDALTDAQKALVKNYQKLVDAERDIALLDATDEDIAAAEAVQKLIEDLPELVSLDDKEAVEEARKAYDALTEIQKQLVTNYQKLLDAEARLKLLEDQQGTLDIYTVTGEFIETLDMEEATELYALGMARSGREVSEDFYDSLVAYVNDYINEDGQLHRSRSEENARMILVLTALGYDVTDVGGHDLLMGLSDMEYLKKQGVTGPAWALIALDSHDYEVPVNPNAADQTSREKLLDYLMEERKEDGGWSLTGKLSDAETTAIVLTALAPYYPEDEDEELDADEKEMKAAVDAAVQILSTLQNADGSYSAMTNDYMDVAPNSMCTAQVLTAISALEINGHTDERFVKNGKSLVDALCEYYVEGGGFSAQKDGDRDDEATELCYNALTAYLRMLNEENSLYDMSDVEIRVTAPAPAAAPEEPEPTEAPAATEAPEAPEVPETQEPEEDDGGFWGWLTGLFK